MKDKNQHNIYMQSSLKIMSLWLDRAIVSFSKKQGKEGFNRVKLMRVNQLAPNPAEFEQFW